MTFRPTEKNDSGFALIEIIIIAVVVLGLGTVVTLRYQDAENKQNASERQAAEQLTTDSVKLSASEKAAKIAEEKKKADEAAKQTAAAPTPAAPAPAAPKPAGPSSARYNSPLDNFEQLDPETAYVVNPNGAKIYSGYFTDQVVKTLPYGTQLKVHRQDGTRAAVDGVSGEPADADWAIDPKDVRRSL